MTSATDSGSTPRKKLIEVALPLEEINKQSAREKSIRHGHPSTLHLWWARRPLAACRAVLFAQLVDDPSSRPDEFPTAEDQALERKRLFELIERLVNWDNINDKALYEKAREEILKSCGGNPPPILDPFAGGGSIPLEAQRLGLEAHASDLNPVAVLINKALIEIPAKWAGRPPVFPGVAESRMGEWPGATGLAEDVRRYGQWMRDEAKKRIGDLYPKAKLPDGTEVDVIAWLWARTVTCPNPACGGTMPLIRSFWLGKKKGKERYVEPIVEGKRVRFEIRGPEGRPREGTVGTKGAICLICNSPVPLSYIRAEGKANRMGVQLMAIVAEGPRMRYYLPPDEEHERIANAVRIDDLPDMQIPNNPRDFKTPNYGLDTFGKLFTNRQLVALNTFSDLVGEVQEKIYADALASDRRATPGASLHVSTDDAKSYSQSVAVYLAIMVSKAADRLSNICTWDSSTKTEGTRNVFARQSIPMVWDYSEANPFVDSSGGIRKAEKAIFETIRLLPVLRQGNVSQLNASSRSYDGVLICTDPPYYDNINYSDLSDFFYIWLRRSLGATFPALFSTLLTPKSEELIANPYRQGGRDEAVRFFEEGFKRVFSRIRCGVPGDFPMILFYAFKQAESDENGEASTGWETLLEGLIQSGWVITATWPIRTELGNRMLGHNKNTLASSVVLACRPRPEHSQVIDRRGLINALKAELPGALRLLQQGGIAPVDMAQAAIGPGMAVFSRYAKVTEPNGSPMRVREALKIINQMLAEVLSDQEGDFDSDTRFCVKWFESYGFDEGKYGEAESLSKAMNTAVDGLERAGVLKARAGIVRLLSPDELPDAYNPLADDRISVWEVVMHLAKRLDERGIGAAAEFMAAAKRRIDLDTAKELTYLLFSICERRNWAKTALLFNALGSSWTVIEQESRSAPAASIQGTFDFSEGEV